MSTSDLLITSYQGILMRGAAGQEVKIGARDTGTSTVVPYVEFQHGGDVKIRLQRLFTSECEMYIETYAGDKVWSVDQDGEIYGRMDGYGLVDRVCNCGFTPDDHFTSGSIPSGYAWAGAPFSGTPANLDYDYQGSYLWCGPVSPGANERFFLYDSVSTYLNKGFEARIGCGHSSRVGIRFDDGSDNNYREIYLDPSATTTGLYDLVEEWRDGGGAVNTNTVIPNLPFNGAFFVD